MKELIKNLIKKILTSQNISYYKNIDNIKLKEIIKLFRPFYLGYELKRVGRNGDGGYLVPDLLNEIKYCFSAGVGDQSSFENELLNNNIKSFLADFSVDFKENSGNLQFDKKFIRSYNSFNSWNVNYWISQKISSGTEENCILQMDIEGSEYDVISSITEENLKRFKILVIEFHSLEYLGNELVYNIVKSSLEKLLQIFDICHIHPNNWKEKTKINNYKFPSNLEVTFLNKNAVKDKKKINFLPNYFDIKNVSNKPDVILDEYWYK